MTPISPISMRDHLGTTHGTVNAGGTFSPGGVLDSFGGPSGDFTGREYDNFTGLYYYRARMYDPELGRFISEDPIGFYGGINLYSYVENQPQRFADPFGLFPSIFPFDYHQRMGSVALDGRATPRQIQSINWSNGDFDLRTQDAIYAPYHAMRRPGQSIEEARAAANEFVRDRICKAREYAGHGMNTYAMHELGKAMHTLQDAESPAHAGFQEAWPSDPLSMVLNLPHYVRESFFVGPNRAAAVESTRKVWDYYSGSPMPSNFFPNSNDGAYSCQCP